MQKWLFLLHIKRNQTLFPETSIPLFEIASGKMNQPKNFNLFCRNSSEYECEKVKIEHEMNKITEVFSAAFRFFCIKIVIQILNTFE
jgi:hypothetical protein